MNTPKTLLAGPILRNVSPSLTDSSKTNVSVFLATSKPDQIKLDLYERTSPGSTFVRINQLSNPIASQTATPLRIGDKLFALVISLSTTLRPGVQYYYNITVGTNEDLRQMGLLTGKAALGYDENVLPSFVLPAQNRNDLHLFHASCRKPHGEGRDALAILDMKIKDQVNDPIKRPQQLFLGGDQIYADDVDPLLLSWIMEKGNEYIYGEGSQKESLAGFVYPLITDSPTETYELPPGATTAIDVDETTYTLFKIIFPKRRSGFIHRKTGFSSKESGSHLLYLADYFMMYLFAWSPELWPKKTDGTLIDISSSYATSHPLMSKDVFKLGDVHKEELENFFKALPYVRRALANISTYMIFDDHEVSDDWSIHQKWLKDVRRSSDGEKVVCNALLAYAIFQDWGNNALTATPKYQILDNGNRFLIDNRVSWQRDQHNHSNSLITHLGASASSMLSVPQTTHIQWSYHIQFYCHQVMALDIRTYRDVYPSHSEVEEKPPQLIKSDQLSVQIPEATNSNKHLLPIVVSPTPVLGLPFIEHFVQPNVVEGKKANEKHDNESWGTSVKTREELLQRLCAYEKAVILSGDVHYAFSNQTSYFDERSSVEKKGKIIQLCASSLHNRTSGLTGTTRVAKIGYDDPQYHGSYIDFLGYPNKNALGRLPSISPSFWHLVYVYIVKDKTDSARDFQLISYSVAPPLVMPKYKDKNHSKIKPDSRFPVKWRYRIHYLIDQERSVRKCVPSAKIPESIAGHKNYADYNFPDPKEKEVVGENNIGEVTFLDDLDETVNHYIHRYSNPELEVPPPIPEAIDSSLFEGVTTIIHSASLAPPQESEKPENFKETARSPS